MQYSPAPDHVKPNDFGTSSACSPGAGRPAATVYRHRQDILGTGNVAQWQSAGLLPGLRRFDSCHSTRCSSLVEHQAVNLTVEGSTPSISSKGVFRPWVRKTRHVQVVFDIRVSGPACGAGREPRSGFSQSAGRNRHRPSQAARAPDDGEGGPGSGCTLLACGPVRAPRHPLAGARRQPRPAGPEAHFAPSPGGARKLSDRIVPPPSPPPRGKHGRHGPDTKQGGPACDRHNRERTLGRMT